MDLMASNLIQTNGAHLSIPWGWVWNGVAR